MHHLLRQHAPGSPCRLSLHLRNFFAYVDGSTPNPRLTADSLASGDFCHPYLWTNLGPCPCLRLHTSILSSKILLPSCLPLGSFTTQWLLFDFGVRLSSLESSSFFLVYISYYLFCPSRQESTIHHSLKF